MNNTAGVKRLLVYTKNRRISSGLCRASTSVLPVTRRQPILPVLSMTSDNSTVSQLTCVRKANKYSRNSHNYKLILYGFPEPCRLNWYIITNKSHNVWIFALTSIIRSGPGQSQLVPCWSPFPRALPAHPFWVFHR